MIDMVGIKRKTQLKVGSLVTYDEGGDFFKNWCHLYPEGTFGMLMKIDFDNTHPYTVPYTVRWFFRNVERNRTSQMADWTLRPYEGV